MTSKRKLRLRTRARVSSSWKSSGLASLCCLILSAHSHGQDTQVESPTFRARTDDSAIRDIDSVRERLKRVTDARGPVNPLADYVRPRRESNEPLPKPAEPAKRRVTSDVDEEATRIPSLNADAQRRLKTQPPSVSPTELSIIGLYPPPQIVSNAAIPNLDRWNDDGFRPSSYVTTATMSTPTYPMEGAVSIPTVSDGWPVTANYMQNDPAAMLPPTLGSPSGSAPAYGLPSSLPPSNPGIPSYGPAPTNLGTAPSSIAPGQGSVVLPAPPSYVVPTQPTNPYASPVLPPGGAIMPPGSNAVPGRAGATMPYSDVMPSYSRSGTFVNNAPFVSGPPEAKDARWMVSPEVYRRASGEMCGPSSTGTTFPIAGAPTGNSSPFFYAPPVAMPPQTASSSWHSSLMRPFQHMSRHFQR